MPILSHSIMPSSLQIPLPLLLLLLLLLLLFFLSISASAASASISDAVVGHQFGNERRLLQVKKPCPVNFENQNYTVLTSQCKGPDYPAEPCCSGLKDFACPFADQINDSTTDCSTVMFSYIDKVGQYPAGLFASKCREGKDGLQCPAQPPLSTPNAATPMVGRPVFMLMSLLLFPLQFVV